MYSYKITKENTVARQQFVKAELQILTIKQF